jgi:hypothetical protein
MRFKIIMGMAFSSFVVSALLIQCTNKSSPVNSVSAPTPSVTPTVTPTPTPTPVCAPTTTTYYVSNSGNDTNTGTSSSSPWATLTKVNGTTHSPCTTIYFQRGGIWRGQLYPQNGSSSEGPITYSAYGSGNLPELRGSVAVTGTSIWASQGNSIWKSTQAVTDSANGSLPLDVQLFFIDNIGEVTPGFKQFSQADLTANGDFFSDPATGFVYIYSPVNPGTAYPTIEVGLSKDIIKASLASYFVIENFSLKFGAQNGINCANCSNVRIQDSEFSFIGGGAWAGHIGNSSGIQRLGNAIQFWANADNLLIQRNKIWEIYDTALTNQNDNSSTAHITNVTYQNNVIWRTPHSGLELWNRGTNNSSMANIKYIHNTSADLSSGWSNKQRPDLKSSHVYLGPSTTPPTGILIANNIYYGGFVQNWVQFTDASHWNATTTTIKNNSYFLSSPNETLDITPFGRWTATTTTNVFQMSFTTGKPQVQINSGSVDCTTGVSAISGLTSNGKCFYDTSQGNFYLYWSGAWPTSILATVTLSTVILVDQGKTYSLNQFSSYQSEMQWDQNSQNVDPAFVSVANHDYHLLLASPAGVRLGGAFLGILDDFEQWTRSLSGIGPSMGAFEYHP